MEKVNAEVRVVSFDALADVLDGGDVERNWDAVDGKDDRLKPFICLENMIIEIFLFSI